MESDKPQIQLEEISPEVKSYIYQVIQEFDAFTTPETSIVVVARDPLKLLSQGDEESRLTLPNRKQLKKMYRIGILVSEDGTTLEEEGLHSDIFEAIRIAKDKLLKQLNELQDEMMSNQDRAAQIHDAKATGQVH